MENIVEVDEPLLPDPPATPPVFSANPVLRPREQVEKHIRDAILNSALKNGDRLPSEADLAHGFGVSRNTVREALRSLSAKGFIRIRPGARGGSFVQIIDGNAFEDSLADSMDNLLKLGSINIAEVSAVRAFLEVPATRLAALYRTDEDLETINTILETASRMTVEDPEMPASDASFHSAVAAASNNRILASFVGALHATTRPASHLDLSVDFGREGLKQHRQIVNAIAEMDPNAAEEAIRNHLEYIDKHRKR